MSLPNVQLKSNYILNWQLGALSLQGKGDGSAYLDTVKLLVRLNGRTYQKNGANYWRVDDTKIEVKPANIRVQFNNLFNGNKDLERVGNEVINQNIELLKNDIIPQVEKGLEKKVMLIVNQIFSKATAEEFFP